MAFTPATSNTWWFCTSYLIVLLLSPFLNKICDSISQRQFQYLLAVLLAVYSLSPTFLMHSLSGSPNGKCTENMIPMSQDNHDDEQALHYIQVLATLLFFHDSKKQFLIWYCNTLISLQK